MATIGYVLICDMTIDMVIFFQCAGSVPPDTLGKLAECPSGVVCRWVRTSVLVQDMRILQSEWQHKPIIRTVFNIVGFPRSFSGFLSVPHRHTQTPSR